MNVRFFEKIIIENWLKFLGITNTILSFAFLCSPLISSYAWRLFFFFLSIGILFLSYIIIFLYYKYRKRIQLKINNTEVNIVFGNIFKEEGKKVIAFNEYFDTLVDNKIIAVNSLNGQLILNHISRDTIDKAIENDTSLKSSGCVPNRSPGKTKKYFLGQIHEINDYFLLAFTHFNNKNEAILSSNEYASCLMEMWKNLNTKYAQHKISIPLLGSGITRITDDRTATSQELLESLLTTLKLSHMSFKAPSDITIVLYPGENNDRYSDFNFARIKYLFK